MTTLDAATALNVTTLCEAFQITAAGTLRRAHGDCPHLKHLVLVDGSEGMLTLEQLEAAGDPGFELATTCPAVAPQDVVTLIYTSGTTGPPKGVRLTPAAVIANARAMHLTMPGYREGFSAVSYLPLAGGRAGVVEHYGCLLLGGTLTCCAELGDLATALRDARPTRFGWPSTGGPMRRCCPACGRGWGWTGSRPRWSGRHRSPRR